MANRNTRLILKNSDIVNRPLPSSLLKGEAIVNTADGIVLFSGITTSTSEWTPAGTGSTANFFEVGSNLYDLKLRNKITKYQGQSGSGLVGKFLSGTTTGFVLANITDIADSYTTGATWSPNTLTLSLSNGRPNVPVIIDSFNGVTLYGTSNVNGDLTVTGTTNLNGPAYYNQTVVGTNPNEIANVAFVTGFTSSSDTFVTGGTVTSLGDLELFRNDGATVTVPKVTYWTSGSTGTDSIKAINPTGLDSTGDRAVSWGYQTLASGNDSTAWGYQTSATNIGSTASGYQTLASGQYSHAEGKQTTSIGERSHSEGENTTATGNTSHAEGLSTTAIGEGSHTEGQLTTAIGSASHAEGVETRAIGEHSHAEGGQTYSLGNNSHSEGGETTSIGRFSHSEGYGTKAIGWASHSEGGYFDEVLIFYTGGTAIGSGSHAEGVETTAIGGYSHSEGRLTIASGTSSHAEGYQTTAQGDYSHSEGEQTTASGIGSSSKGYLTIASGKQSTASGYYTTASGDYGSHAEGWGSTANGIASHAEGYYTTASNSYSHAEGYGTLASGFRSHAEGRSTTSSGYHSHAEGESTIASGQGSHTEGYKTTAIGNYSHSEGRETTTLSLAVNGHAEGNATTAGGSNSHAEGFLTLSSGDSSHAEGIRTTALGRSSHSQGSGTTAVGIASFASGFNSRAVTNGTFIHSENSLVSGQRSVVLGGQNITGSTNDTVFVPYLNLNYVPTLNNSNTQILSRNTSTGQVEYTTLSAFTSLDTFVTGFTYNPTNNSFTISRNQGQPSLITSIGSVSGLTVSNLTSGRVVYVGTGGLLTDESGFEYNQGTNLLTVGNINVQNSLGTEANIGQGGLVIGSGGSFITPGAGDLTVHGNLTVFGTATTVATSELYVEDPQVTLNYNPTGDTSPTSVSSGIKIQDGNGTSTGDTYFTIGLMQNLLSGDTSEYTGLTGYSNRGWVTQLNDIVIRNTNLNEGAPDGVRVLAEGDILDGGQY